MQITVTAVQDFIHCAYSMDKGQKTLMPEQTAKDLRAVGLVDYDDAAPGPQEKQAIEPKNKMMPEPENKSAPAKTIKSKAP